MRLSIFILNFYETRSTSSSHTPAALITYYRFSSRTTTSLLVLPYSVLLLLILRHFSSNATLHFTSFLLIYSKFSPLKSSPSQVVLYFFSNFIHNNKKQHTYSNPKSLPLLHKYFEHLYLKLDTYSLSNILFRTLILINVRTRSFEFTSIIISIPFFGLVLPRYII